METTPTKKIIVRYPPSPTGKLHVGNVRTLLFNYFFAKKHAGKIVFRSEDTDRARSMPEHVEYQKEVFSWLGMEYDEFYRQSDRAAIYKKYLESMIDAGTAYVSKESHTPEALQKAKEEGKELRSSVIRFKNPNKVITFTDLVFGEISVDTTDLGDFVIAKDLEYALYHLTVVIDDYEMGITHVIRGADHITNTPRQILIQQAIGAERPAYAHIPLVVGLDGKKLSKRHGATATLEYREAGYSAEAFVNFLAFVGWNPGTEQEIFSLEELLAAFDISGIQKSPAVFNEEKLQWFNREHLKTLSPEELEDLLLPELASIPEYSLEIGRKIIPLILERIHILGDIRDLIAEGELQYYFTKPVIDQQILIWKKSDAETTQKHLTTVHEMLTEYTGDWSAEDLKTLLWDYATEHGKGDVLWPIRYALSGKEKSPDPFTLLSVLEKEESLERIKAASAQ
jgi:glutamyl-tRNA synthetase